MQMKTLTFSIVLLALTSSQINAASPRDPYEYFFQQSLGDLNEEIEIAVEGGKKGIFVFFEMDECPFCHRMKNTVLNNPEIQELFSQEFHSLSIDIEGDIEMTDFQGNELTQKEFASQNRVRATPVLAFFDLEGQQVFRYTGAASGIEEFKWMAEFVTEGVYKMKDDNGRPIRFSRFKRLKKQQQ
ncbi:MAG: thioredoxin-related protein [Gammaproteobacteria bacterium]|jgi:thioredoxin-related protein